MCWVQAATAEKRRKAEPSRFAKQASAPSAEQASYAQQFWKFLPLARMTSRPAFAASPPSSYAVPRLAIAQSMPCCCCLNATASGIPHL